MIGRPGVKNRFLISELERIFVYAVATDSAMMLLLQKLYDNRRHETGQQWQHLQI